MQLRQSSARDILNGTIGGVLATVIVMAGNAGWGALSEMSAPEVHALAMTYAGPAAGLGAMSGVLLGMFVQSDWRRDRDMRVAIRLLTVLLGVCLTVGVAATIALSVTPT